MLVKHLWSLSGEVLYFGRATRFKTQFSSNRRVSVDSIIRVAQDRTKFNEVKAWVKVVLSFCR